VERVNGSRLNWTRRIGPEGLELGVINVGVVASGAGVIYERFIV